MRGRVCIDLGADRERLLIFPMSNPVNFIRELKTYLSGRAAMYRARRAYGPLLDIEVAAEITDDAMRQQNGIAADGYSAEQADLEAAKLLDGVLADNLMPKAEKDALRRAEKLIRQSAAKDHAITELAMA